MTHSQDTAGPLQGAADFVIGLDHLQLAIPRGAEDRARAFYCLMLGLPEIPKPPMLAARGGLWLKLGAQQLHLGVEEPFALARKAHPAFRIRRYADLLRTLRDADHPVVEDALVEGVQRAFVHDPFGNRIELIDAEA